jgi:hypothetical protein
MRSIGIIAALIVLAWRPGSARADHHLMLIREVYAGGGDPTAQYVMLQMYAVGQGNLTRLPTNVTVYDASGLNPTTSAFMMNVSNDANQATILVGTASVSTAFGVTPDLVMSSPTLSPAGGKVCYQSSDCGACDCVAWGNYSAGTDTTVGSPVAPSGIPSGMAIRRKITSGNPTTLDNPDDHNASATDFEVVAPNPIPNSTPVSSTTTTIHGGSSSTTSTTTSGSTPTTTTLPCAAGGVDGALCLLNDLPPMVCRPNPLPRRVRIKLQAAKNALQRSKSEIGGHHNRLVKKADKQLVAAGSALDRAVAKGGKITDQCATALRPFIDAARLRLAQVLPPS